MNGACPCGGVTVIVPRRPEYLNSCNCTLCFKLGGLWSYFDPDEVTVEGETKGFRRSDIDVWLQTNFCPTCSAVVSWTAVRHLDTPRMGVNMRLFEPEDLVGIPVHFNDGRNWSDKSPRPAQRREPVPFSHREPF